MSEGATPKAPAAAKPRKPRARKAAAPVTTEADALAPTPDGPTIDPEHPQPGQPPMPADPGKTCANCGTPLIGHYCHECGQQAHLHNKLGHLLHEFVEGIAHFDGRLWRTLPIMVLRPGRLSRDWIEGKRARYVAPLHIFLFAMFLVFTIPSVIHAFTPADSQKEEATFKFDGAPKSPAEREVYFKEQRAKMLEALKDPDKQSDADQFALKASLAVTDFFGPKVGKSEYYGYKIKTLAYKLSFLLAPMAMGILWLLLLYRRGYSLYDHGTVALYGLGFLALAIAFGELLPQGIAGLWWLILMIFAPIHAVRHLKVAYAMSWPGAVVVGAVMGVLTALALLLFTIGVFALGFTG